MLLSIVQSEEESRAAIICPASSQLVTYAAFLAVYCTATYTIASPDENDRVGTMLAEAVAVAAVAGVTLYLYLIWNYSYWRKKGIVQAEPVFPGVGNLLDAVLLRKSVNVIHNEIYRQFPGHPVVGLYHFRQPALLIRDPEVIQTVLVTNFSKFHDNNFTVSEKLEPLTEKSPFFAHGPKWKENRSALAPGFTNTRVKTVYPKMQELCEQLVQYLDKHTGEDIETRDLAYLFTTDVVSNCAFGVASSAITGEETMFMKYGKMLVTERLENGFLLLALFFMPTVAKLLRLRFIPPKLNGFVEKTVNTVIDYRKRNNVTQNDFIQVLLKNKEKSLSEANPDDKNAQESINKALLGHCLTFFSEGFETSTNTISYTMYELAMNTDIQHRLREELEDATSDGKPLDYDTLTRLPYLDKVVSETLRKYPLMSSMIRLCTEETTLEINGKSVKIDVGTPIAIPVVALHNDPVNFPNPDKYDPERFSEENVAQRHRYCYLPFGEGPRICVGMRFGLAQVKAFLATTVLNYDIQKCDRTTDKIEFHKNALLLVSSHGLWVRLEKHHRRRSE